MTTSTANPTIIVNKSNPQVGTGGVRYHKPVTDAIISLPVQPGDVFEPLAEEKSKAFAVDLLTKIDDAQLEAFSSSTNLDDAEAAGRAHGSAQALAYLLHAEDLQENPRDYNFEAIGERIMEDRNEAFKMEDSSGWSGPGDLSAVARQSAVNYFRTESSDLFAQAEAPGFAADTSVHLFARSSALLDAADALSERF